MLIWLYHFFFQINGSCPAFTSFFIRIGAQNAVDSMMYGNCCPTLKVFAVCDEDERLNDSSEYMLNIDGSGKNCKTILRLDASESGRLWEVKLILGFFLFYHHFFHNRKNGKGMHQQQQQHLTNSLSLQGKIYTQQQQQQQLENPTEANVSLQDPRVRSSHRNTCIFLSAVIVVAYLMNNQRTHQHQMEMPASFGEKLENLSHNF